MKAQLQTVHLMKLGGNSEHFCLHLFMHIWNTSQIFALLRQCYRVLQVPERLFKLFKICHVITHPNSIACAYHNKIIILVRHLCCKSVACHSNSVFSTKVTTVQINNYVCSGVFHVRVGYTICRQEPQLQIGTCCCKSNHFIGKYHTTGCQKLLFFASY
jgi:hypothetical protein